MSKDIEDIFPQILVFCVAVVILIFTISGYIEKKQLLLERLEMYIATECR